MVRDTCPDKSDRPGASADRTVRVPTWTGCGVGAQYVVRCLQKVVASRFQRLRVLADGVRIATGIVKWHECAELHLVHPNNKRCSGRHERRGDKEPPTHGLQRVVVTPHRRFPQSDQESRGVAAARRTDGLLALHAELGAALLPVTLDVTDADAVAALPGSLPPD